VIADCAAAAGVFAAAASVVARRAGSTGGGLLGAVTALAAITTATLSLDTTVVLLTPVVLATVRNRDAEPRPHLYATAHLANSASLLLPVSNLTNLLALAVLPISFLRFVGLMALPWLVAIAVELAGHRVVFRRDLEAPIGAAPTARTSFPRFATAVVALTVAGFAVASLAGLEPVWVATAGTVILAGQRLVARDVTVRRVITAAAPLFCLFVMGLAVAVRIISDHGLGDLLRHAMPDGTSLPVLLGVAGIAAVLSNVVNNLPATLVLLPVAMASGGVAAVLAVLIGVNIGPNLTYQGSLATLLWRRGVAEVPGVPDLGVFTRLGLATVPAGILAATCALWLSIRVIGV
ncbi:MAG: hypothetical protein JO246_03705, partial [Frankiaceae bacterium]|nr:hypothetical protein [Frankiaceae bacterium]